MKEKTINLKENDSNEDWSEKYKGDKPASDSTWFSDIVQQDEISFVTEITFKTEGEEVINKFGKPVIRFTIDHERIEKTMEVSCNQYDYLKTLILNKPLIGKTAKHSRTGSTQKDTRRNIKF